MEDKFERVYMTQQHFNMYFRDVCPNCYYIGSMKDESEPTSHQSCVRCGAHIGLNDFDWDRLNEEDYDAKEANRLYMLVPRKTPGSGCLSQG
jgi:hypothetical protein